MNFPYIGNGAYCYANSTSMLLASIGENIPPGVIEPITGTGLSTTIEKSGFLFFNHPILDPDLGIIEALKILGFRADVKVNETEDTMPFGKLTKTLQKQPAILGPVDMGYLVYQPNHEYVHGSDHFVFAYAAKEDKIYLHDPAGFPHVYISQDDLKMSWKADKVWYRKGYYRYITNPERISSPTQDKIYSATLKRFQTIYQEGERKAVSENMLIGSPAILNTVERLKKNHVSQPELNNYIYFVFPLGAKRALDFASFFDFKDSDLAELKRQQAKLFGEAHTFAVAKNWDGLGKILKELAEVEEKFKTALLA